MPSASPDLVCVDPDIVCDFWPHARHLIKNAIEASNISRFEDIEAEVLDGKMLLWLAWSGKIEAAVVTQLTHDALVIVACGGEMRKRWLHLLEQIEQYGRNEHRKRILIIGRRGWERVLDGYHVEQVILQKDLNGH